MLISLDFSEVTCTVQLSTLLLTSPSSWCRCLQINKTVCQPPKDVFAPKDDLCRRAADWCAPGDLWRSPPDLCGRHQGICGGQKIGAFGQICPTQERVQLLCSQTALQSKREILSPHPDIDEIRWQNSSGRDSRLIVRRPLLKQVTM